MNELRPKLFDVIKGYTKEQLIRISFPVSLLPSLLCHYRLPLRLHPVLVRNRGFILQLSQDFLFHSLAEAVYRLAVRLPLSLLSSMASLQSMEPTV